MGNNLICFKKVNSGKKLTISNSESFLEEILGSTNYEKYSLDKAIKFGSVTQLAFVMFSRKIGEMFWWSRKSQKIKVWRNLGHVKTKNLLAQRILDKIFWRKYPNPVNLDRVRKVWYLLFSCYLSQISGGKKED